MRRIRQPESQPDLREPVTSPAYSRVVIMAAGNGKRWKNHLGVPKQLAPVKGEPILLRTIRLLKERGITDIWVTVKHKGQYGELGVNEYVPQDNVYGIDRIYASRELAPAIFLYGDCYYTEGAIDVILKDRHDFWFFGRYHKSRVKANGEIYAIKVSDYVIQKTGELRQLVAGKTIRQAIGQTLHRYLEGGKPQGGTIKVRHIKHVDRKYFTEINDGTEDFDTPEQYDKFVGNVTKQPARSVRRAAPRAKPIVYPRVVLMAAGEDKRWANYMDTPKQLLAVDGEPIIIRTIRLLKERGITDIWVTVRSRGQYGDLGVNEFVNVDENIYTIDRLYGCRQLSPAVFLFGDVYFSEEAIDTILADTHDLRFFGRKGPGRVKKNREVYGVKANDYVMQKAGELRELHSSGQIKESLLGHLLSFCLNYKPVNGNIYAPRQALSPLFTDITDDTTDFDEAQDYATFLELRNEVHEVGKHTIGKYYSLGEFNADLVHKLLPQIPSSVDLVVGIPRDGVLAAYLIAVQRNIPMTDLASFCKRHIYGMGRKHKEVAPARHILLVDDICASGATMRQSIRQIKPHLRGAKMDTATVYAKDGSSNLLSFWGAKLKGYRVYQWTLADAVVLPHVIMDIDGVLCPDFDGADTSKKYAEWLAKAPLKLRPRNVGCLITWREEKHRAVTEAWLRRNGITYGKLIMANRSQWSSSVEYKASHYQRSGYRLLVESHNHKAKAIAARCCMPVLAFDTNEVFGLES